MAWYPMTDKIRALRAAPWTCPRCGKTMKAGGKGPHLTYCGKDYTPRFWAKVNKTDGCWLWTGSKTYFGYGHFGISHTIGQEPHSRKMLAHRYSWELAYGPIPKGMYVLHRCDVASCVRPDHLFLGDDATNAADRQAKGRGARGEMIKRNKLAETQAREILALKGKAASKELAAKYGVGLGAITAIWAGRAWKHIHCT